LFISTHSDQLHKEVQCKLESAGYLVEVSSGYSEHTTSMDGFICASSPLALRMFENFSPLGRLEILNSRSIDLVSYLGDVELNVGDKLISKETD